jgi:hypothetical protein
MKLNDEIISLHLKGMSNNDIATELKTTTGNVESVIKGSNPSNFTHETFIPSEHIPKTAIYRSITVGKHIIRIASWGNVIGRTSAGMPRHEHSELQSVLHPKELGKCRFIDAMRSTGQLRHLLEVGKLQINTIKNAQMLPCPKCKFENPVPRVNINMKCGQCGTRLLSVKVHRKYK